MATGNDSVKITAKFTKEQVSVAIISHFKLPLDTSIVFVLNSKWENDRMGGGSTKVFHGANATFRKPLNEVLDA